MLLTPKKKKEQSVYANRGTALHALAEDLILDRTPEKVYEGYKWTEDDLKLTVEPYVDYAKGICSEVHHSWIEKKVFITESCYGTADCIAYDEESNSLHVIDFKAGAGVFVQTRDNTQLQIYAIGAIRFLLEQGYSEPEKVVIHIVQPGIDNICALEVDVSDLRALRKSIIKVEKGFAHGVGEYAPSEEACRWCDHKVDCPKLNEVANKIARDDFEDVELGEKMKLVPSLKLFIKAVEEETLKTFQQDRQVPGFKLVRGRGRRVWKDENLAVTDFSLAGLEVDDLYKSSFLTVAQLEKIIKKKKLEIELDEYVAYKEGPLKVVPEESLGKQVDRVAEAVGDFS